MDWRLRLALRLKQSGQLFYNVESHAERPFATGSPQRFMTNDTTKPEPKPSRPACPVCGGAMIEIRAKLQCSRCHTICETCCEGGPG
ncbi:hypothetical protein RMSM_06439 [Rhodopirellula maiorica SM1]|uniref:Uncharacterized protein n=1 Tax=Rhodopirellula maiorica SM1 TaxID=1265738 RepID=M5RC46_9BACT|nr:hypothetical protein RMSM_06439 [Rhodopirellula maiorica SM1]